MVAAPTQDMGNRQIDASVTDPSYDRYRGADRQRKTHHDDLPRETQVETQPNMAHERHADRERATRYETPSREAQVEAQSNPTQATDQVRGREKHHDSPSQPEARDSKDSSAAKVADPRISTSATNRRPNPRSNEREDSEPIIEPKQLETSAQPVTRSADTVAQSEASTSSHEPVETSSWGIFNVTPSRSRTNDSSSERTNEAGGAKLAPRDSKSTSVSSRRSPTTHRSTAISASHDAKIWKEKYRSKKAALIARERDYEQLRSDTNDAIDRLQDKNQKLQETVDALQTQLEDLQTTHVKSINNVGTGINPVSDQEIAERMGNLQERVNSFFRRVCKGHRPKQDPLVLVQWLKQLNRCYDSSSQCGLTIGNTLEMIFWSILEQAHVSRAFIPDHKNEWAPFAIVERDIRFADSSAQKERSEFWRSYTTSVLTQGPEWTKFFSRGMYKEIDNIIRSLNILTGVSLSASDANELDDHIEDFFELSIALKRQRPWYEFDMGVAPGTRFRKDVMEDFKHKMEDDGECVVEAIVTRGLYRKQHRDATEIQKVLIKARVTVGRERSSLM